MAYPSAEDPFLGAEFTLSGAVAALLVDVCTAIHAISASGKRAPNAARDPFERARVQTDGLTAALSSP